MTVHVFGRKEGAKGLHVSVKGLQWGPSEADVTPSEDSVEVFGAISAFLPIIYQVGVDELAVKETTKLWPSLSMGVEEGGSVVDVALCYLRYPITYLAHGLSAMCTGGHDGRRGIRGGEGGVVPIPQLNLVRRAKATLRGEGPRP
jgi:hypothetical protein